VRATVEEALAAGDRVVARWTWRGTRRGAFLGLAPTGKAVTGSGIGLFRLAQGRLAEDFVQEDTLGLLQQLGAVPTPGAP
jgi:predicted ester cyclase